MAKIKHNIFQTVMVMAVALAGSCSTFRPSSEPETRTIYFADSAMTVKGDSVISRITASEDNYLIGVVPDQRSQYLLEKKRILFSSLMVILIIAVAFVIYAVLKRQMINKLNRRCDDISGTVEKLLEDRISMIEEMSRQNQSLKEKTATEFYPEELESLKNKVSTISLSMERLYQKVPMTKTLETAVNTTRDGIMDKAREILGDSIKDSDYTILAGALSGLKAKEIGFVTGLTPTTVRVRKSRLKEKIEALPDSIEKEMILSAFSKKDA